MKTLLCIGLVLGCVSAIAVLQEISEYDKERCHVPLGRRHHSHCDAYKTATSTTGYGTLGANCLKVTWATANTSQTTLGTGAWGSCVNITTDTQYRYVISNAVPNYYFNPYCPFGLYGGYCVPAEQCPFPTLVCGVSKSSGYTALGDVWVPYQFKMKIPLVGNPTLSDRPADMYKVASGGEKNFGAAIGFAIENGVDIQGPNDAGGVSVDEAGFQLMCGGHVTPPQGNPMYHYHKAPDCLTAFTQDSKPYSHGATIGKHGSLYGYALDGFGIYTYQDIGGAQAVLDECGGHFGPVSDDDDTVVYHYHAKTYNPYHLACQGPSLGNCARTQGSANFCAAGCGAQVCVQPGTSTDALNAYLNGFDSTWLSKYTVNNYTSF